MRYQSNQFEIEVRAIWLGSAAWERAETIGACPDLTGIQDLPWVPSILSLRQKKSGYLRLMQQLNIERNGGTTVIRARWFDGENHILRLRRER